MAYIYYNYGTKLKVDGVKGQDYCMNCRHTAPQVLAREISYMNLFGFIPLFRHTADQGCMCTNCGNMITMGKAEYQNVKNQLPEVAKNV